MFGAIGSFVGLIRRRDLMLKLSQLGHGALAAVVVGAIAAGAVTGCGDNKPKARPTTDGGGDTSMICSGSFVSPTNGATLTAADDLNKSCSGSLHVNVSLATSADDGANVDLYVGSTKVDTQKVSGAEVHFMNVQLPNGPNMLQAVFSASCTISETVTVNCNLPMCKITAPTLSATHPDLNGVPVANGGDRVSAAGSPYQAQFAVSTNIEDGQKVQLRVTPMGSTTATVVEQTAVGGTATFMGVTLVPDGNYTVEADCTNKAGVLGQSSQAIYPVDSTPPALTISSPPNNKFFGPADLTNGAFQVCAQTPDKDATALPATLGAAAKNLSVAVGTSSPDSTNGFVAVTATNTDTCVNVACTSSTPVDLTVTLNDAAGNATTKTISQISCATALPGVQIVSPTSDSTPFGDPTKHLLASSSLNALKDQDGVTPGAQWTVIACADKAGMATLFGGSMGGTLTSLAGPVPTMAAVPADQCPNGYSQAAHFTSASLPDSQEDTDGTLLSATELRVDVTTATSATGSSPLVDLWIDSSAPNVQQSIPNPLCGLVHQGMTAWSTALRLLATTPTVTLTVTHGGSSIDYPPTTWMNGFANFAAVGFPLGIDQVTASATEPSGNAGTLTSPCTVTVGTPPIVTFVTPLATNTMCAAGSTSGTCIPDGDSTVAGWQGNLDVTVSVTGADPTGGIVDFTAGTTDLGMATIDATGHARLPGITIPDGKAVVLTAATNDIGGHGIGMTSETLIVDTIKPDPVATVTATVKDRRQTSFHLSWTAPADAGQTLFSYVVKVSKNPITTVNFDAATSISYTGSPAAPNAADGIDATGLLIQTNYYFAVASVDAAGNRGTIATVGPTMATFNMKILTPPAGGPTNERFGFWVDGVSDLNGDGKSDILVGTVSGQRVYIFNGSAAFDTVAAPTTVINGQASVGFGRAFIDVGDIDADGKDDYAISAPLLGNGRIYIFKGRAAWNASYNADSDADYILDLGSTYAATQFGASLARIGDFNGDGVDDFAVGAVGYNGGRGRVVVILGRSGFSAATLNVMTIDGDPAYPAVGTTFGGGAFGGAIVGMGRLYANTSGTTIAVSAAGAGTASAGRVYAFHGITGSSAAINATAADNFVEAPVTGGNYGGSLALVGALAGVPGVAIGTAHTTTIANGFVDLHFGSTIAGPFSANPLRFTDSLATAANDLFGRVLGGCAFSGTSISVSLIGDGKPDLLMAPFTESGGGSARLYIVDGARLFALPNPAEINANADIILPLPTGWQGLPAQRNPIIRDLDGDGHADFAIGELVNAGRLAVFW